MLTDVEGSYRDWPPATRSSRPSPPASCAICCPHWPWEWFQKWKHACGRSMPVSPEHVIDGRVRHSLLVEVFTDQGVGTMVVPGGGSA